jgi:hypothetical protein
LIMIALTQMYVKVYLPATGDCPTDGQSSALAMRRPGGWSTAAVTVPRLNDCAHASFAP